MSIGFIILLLLIIGFVIPTLKREKKRGMASRIKEPPKPLFESLPLWEFDKGETPIFIFYVYSPICGVCAQLNPLYDLMLEKYKPVGLGEVKLNFDTTPANLFPVIKESIQFVPSIIIIGMSGKKYRLENPIRDVPRL